MSRSTLREFKYHRGLCEWPTVQVCKFALFSLTGFKVSFNRDLCESVLSKNLPTNTAWLSWYVRSLTHACTLLTCLLVAWLLPSSHTLWRYTRVIWACVWQLKMLSTDSDQKPSPDVIHRCYPLTVAKAHVIHRLLLGAYVIHRCYPPVVARGHGVHSLLLGPLLALEYHSSMSF